MPATPRAPWSVEDSADLYAVGAWGTGYFGINAAGHAIVRPSRDGEREIDLYEVVRELESMAPGFAFYICDERGCLRTHVNIFVGDERIRDRTRLSDPVSADSRVLIMQALSGG